MFNEGERVQERVTGQIVTVMVAHITGRYVIEWEGGRLATRWEGDLRSLTDALAHHTHGLFMLAREMAPEQLAGVHRIEPPSCPVRVEVPDEADAAVSA